jgi:hypothetical protein
MSRTFEIQKDYAGERLVFKKVQDCAPIIEHNKREQVDPVADLRFGRKVASVPIDVLDAWIKEGVDYRRINKDPEMKKKFFAKLNSPEWRYFKTTVGHIG